MTRPETRERRRKGVWVPEANVCIHNAMNVEGRTSQKQCLETGAGKELGLVTEYIYIYLGIYTHTKHVKEC